MKHLLLLALTLITSSLYGQIHKEIVMATRDGQSAPATGSITIDDDVFLFRLGDLIQTYTVLQKKEEVFKGLLMKSFFVKAKDGSILIFVIDEKSNVISLSFMDDSTEYILHTK
jgi:hypothetical protein